MNIFRLTQVWLMVRALDFQPLSIIFESYHVHFGSRTFVSLDIPYKICGWIGDTEQLLFSGGNQETVLSSENNELE